MGRTIRLLSSALLAGAGFTAVVIQPTVAEAASTCSFDGSATSCQVGSSLTSPTTGTSGNEWHFILTKSSSAASASVFVCWQFASNTTAPYLSPKDCASGYSETAIGALSSTSGKSSWQFFVPEVQGISESNGSPVQPVFAFTTATYSYALTSAVATLSDRPAGAYVTTTTVATGHNQGGTTTTVATGVTEASAGPTTSTTGSAAAASSNSSTTTTAQASGSQSTSVTVPSTTTGAPWASNTWRLTFAAIAAAGALMVFPWRRRRTA